jgi:hypothetical protein
MSTILHLWQRLAVIAALSIVAIAVKAVPVNNQPVNKETAEERKQRSHPDIVVNTVVDNYFIRINK